MLYWKHKVATSALSAPAAHLRAIKARFTALKNPELGLLRQEDQYIDKLLPRFVKRDAHCLDIGGHIGSFAHQLSQLAPAGKVTIVEAVPEKAAWLKKRFGEENVIEAAVSDEAGEASFFVDTARAGFSKLGTGGDGAQGHSISVKVVRLDDVLGDDHIDFIKIDVEGHELKALGGARKMLERDRPPILFEAGALGAEGAEDDSKKLLRWLTEELGYEVFPPFHLIHGRPPVTEAQFDLYRTYPFSCFNYFALPPGRENG